MAILLILNCVPWNFLSVNYKNNSQGIRRLANSYYIQYYFGTVIRVQFPLIIYTYSHWYVHIYLSFSHDPKILFGPTLSPSFISFFSHLYNLSLKGRFLNTAKRFEKSFQEKCTRCFLSFEYHIVDLSTLWHEHMAQSVIFQRRKTYFSFLFKLQDQIWGRQIRHETDCRKGYACLPIMNHRK